MRTALTAAVFLLAASALLPGCGRATYIVEPAVLLAAQRAAETDPKVEVGVLPAPDATKPVFVRVSGVEIETSPQSRYWEVSAPRYHTSVGRGGVLIGLGTLSVLGGAVSMGFIAAGKTCDHVRNDGCYLQESYTGGLVSVPLILAGGIMTTVGAVKLHRGLRRSHPGL